MCSGSRRGDVGCSNTIELIETFLDLCDTRSFNKTADRLGVTQSTISGRIQSLEATLGRTLFTRSRAGTELTLEGLKFEPHARLLRHSWAEALHATRSAGTAAMTLRVGMQHDLTGNMIGGWVRDFREALPDTAFYIEADYSPAMSSDLLIGALDFGMMYTARMHPDLYFEMLGEQGWPGLVLWLWLLLSGLWQMEKVRSRWKKRTAPGETWQAPLANALQQSLIVYMLGSAFVGIAYQPFCYMLIGLQCGLWSYLKRVDSPAGAPQFRKPALRGGNAVAAS